MYNFEIIKNIYMYNLDLYYNINTSKETFRKAKKNIKIIKKMLNNNEKEAKKFIDFMISNNDIKCKIEGYSLSIEYGINIEDSYKFLYEISNDKIYGILAERSISKIKNYNNLRKRCPYCGNIISLKDMFKLGLLHSIECYHCGNKIESNNNLIKVCGILILFFAVTLNVQREYWILCFSIGSVLLTFFSIFFTFPERVD